MTRLKAASFHFVVSLVVVFSCLSFAYFVWYDVIFVEISGVLEPAKILIIVDLILGPFFTFIIFKQGKKSLKFDLSVIVLVQFVALMIGLYTIYQGRPSLVVMKKNSFEIITEKWIDNKNLNDDLLSSISFFSEPQYAYIPEDEFILFTPLIEQQKEILPISSEMTKIKSRKLTSERVLTMSNFSEEELLKFLGTNDLSEFYFYLINDDTAFSLIVFNETGTAVQIVKPKL